MSYNKIILIGNVGADAECRTTQAGQAICTFSVATKEIWTDKNNEKKSRTTWHRIVLFGKQAETFASKIKKGCYLYIEGKIRTRDYTNKDGEEKSITEILAQVIKFLDKRPKEELKNTENTETETELDV